MKIINKCSMQKKKTLNLLILTIKNVIQLFCPVKPSLGLTEEILGPNLWNVLYETLTLGLCFRGVYSGQGAYFFPPSSFQSAYFLPQNFGLHPPPPWCPKNVPFPSQTKFEFVHKLKRIIFVNSQIKQVFVSKKLISLYFELSNVM